MKPVQLKQYDFIRLQCPQCKGTGRRREYDLLPCQRCEGEGVVYMHLHWMRKSERERAPQEAVPAGS